MAGLREVKQNLIWRAFQLTVIALLSWSLMLLFHEGGHLLGGFLSGAKLQDYDLVPWRLPYSIHSPDPHPLITLWSGPILGVLFPWMLYRVKKGELTDTVFSFCLLANGAYLLIGWIQEGTQLDTHRLLESGTSPFLILLYSCLTIIPGYIRLRERFFTGSSIGD